MNKENLTESPVDLGDCLLSWLGKTAKSLFYFTFFSFLIWTYYTRKECGKVSHDNVAYHSHISGCHKVMSHDKCGKVVHRLYSSCISSVQNLIGTPLSSPCQLRLGVWLSHLRLSCYTYTIYSWSMLSPTLIYL